MLYRDRVENNADPVDSQHPADIDDDGDFDFHDAAVRAELDVGHHEDTPKQAWHHALIRLGRMAVGFVLLLAGIAMMVLPGPGGLVAAAGLAILARDVVWADRALRYLRKKVPGLEEEGPIPKSTILVSVMLMAAGALAFWWWRDGGNETIQGWF